MITSFAQRTGLGWRYALALEFWFYFRTCRNWRQVIAARRTDAPLDCFETRSGAVIGFDGPPPFLIFNEVWHHRMYFPEGLATDSSRRVVVDIGANIGFFTLYLKSRWPNARVYAFEPVPQNFKWLERNTRTALPGSVFAYCLAVGARSETRTLFLRPDAGMHSFYPNLFTDQNLAGITVETIDLDRMLELCSPDTIDLLKLDCEGAEFQTLEGKHKLLGERVRQIVMEYHEIETYTVRDLVRVLDAAGFKWRDIPNPKWHSGMLIAHNSANL